MSVLIVCRAILVDATLTKKVANNVDPTQERKRILVFGVARILEKTSQDHSG